MGELGAKWEIARVAIMKMNSTAPVASRKLRRCEGELRIPERVIEGHSPCLKGGGVYSYRQKF
jgi:hypothetical protein